MAGRTRAAMRAIDLVHRWTGGFVGLLLALLGTTGVFLLHQTAFLRLTLPHAADPIARDDAQLAAVVGKVLDDPAGKARAIRLAGENLGVHQVYYKGENAGAYVDQAGGMVTRWSSEWQRPEVWIYDLHRHLLLGDTGMTIIGLAALAGLGFVITGAILWWQTRATFAFWPLPKRLSRSAIVRHHRDLGIVAAPLLLLTFASGTLMALKPVEALVLAPFGGDKAPHAAKDRGAVKVPKAGQVDWAAIIATARAHYPDGELRWIGLPTKKEPRILVRVRQPGEWTKNGRTMLWFDTVGKFSQTRDALTAPRRDRLKNAEYPLHTGDALPWLGRWIMTISGLALMMLGTLAVWSFWFRRPRPARRPVRPAVPVPSGA